MTTADEIVTLIRSQNWKNGGVHSIDHAEAVELVEQYARVIAQEASVTAAAMAYDRCIEKIRTA